MNHTEYTPHTHALSLSYHSNTIPIIPLVIMYPQPRLNVTPERCFTIDQPCCPTRRFSLFPRRQLQVCRGSRLPQSCQAHLLSWYSPPCGVLGASVVVSMRVAGFGHALMSVVDLRVHRPLFLHPSLRPRYQLYYNTFGCV